MRKKILSSCMQKKLRHKEVQISNYLTSSGINEYIFVYLLYNFSITSTLIDHSTIAPGVNKLRALGEFSCTFVGLSIMATRWLPCH